MSEPTPTKRAARKQAEEALQEILPNTERAQWEHELEAERAAREQLQAHYETALNEIEALRPRVEQAEQQLPRLKAELEDEKRRLSSREWKKDIAELAALKLKLEAAEVALREITSAASREYHIAGTNTKIYHGSVHANLMERALEALAQLNE